jgi:hypothetical protein
MKKMNQPVYRKAGSPSLTFTLPVDETVIVGREGELMEEDPPLVRCPACGSALTAPCRYGGMWECRYHLCRVVFPLHGDQTGRQNLLLAEEEPPYRNPPVKE